MLSKKFLIIYTILCVSGKIIKQNKSISYSKSHVPFHFAMELMQTSMKITFKEQFSALCSLIITLLRIIQERREGGGKHIITILSIVLAYKNKKQQLLVYLKIKR